MLGLGLKRKGMMSQWSKTLGPELIVNGDFNIASGSGVGWTASNGATTTGGVGTMPNGGGTLKQNILTPGKIYRFELIARSSEGGKMKISSGGVIFIEGINNPLTITYVKHSADFTAVAADFTIGELGGSDLIVDSVSVKELI